MPKEDKKGFSILAGLFTGAVAGVAAGLLLAPKAGKETRDLVQNRYRAYSESVTKKLRRKKETDDNNR